MGAITPTSVLSGLGTFVPVLTEVSRLVSAVQNVATDPEEERRKQLRAEQNLALQQLAQKQALEEQQSAQSSALEKRRLAAESEAAARQRQAALKRAVARQTAAFGASGIGSSGGSAQAVLLGLFDESDSERAEREKLDALREKALDIGAEQQQSINVLQRSQLAERQNLQLASRY